LELIQHPELKKKKRNWGLGDKLGEGKEGEGRKERKHVE
jgi:hypothetical protein